MSRDQRAEALKKRMAFPERSVAEAVETLWRVVDAGYTSEITPELLAQAAGLRPRGEHLRSLALSMRALGLVRATKAGLKVSRLGWELCDESPGSARYRRLLWEAIHMPSMYSGLPNRFLRIVPGGEKLVDYLMDTHGVPYADAEIAAVNYRDALLYAGLLTPSGERLVPELRVLPRYTPTDSDLEAIEPIPHEDEVIEPPTEYRVPPAMPAMRRSSGSLPTHHLTEGRPEGHRLSLELAEGRQVVIDLPRDIDEDEVDRVVRLLRAMIE